MSVSLSNLYSGSFGSVGFMELYESAMSPAEPDVTEDYTLTHIPGGDTTLLQTSGKVATSFELPVACDGAQKNALRSKVGDDDTLSYHEGEISCHLLAVVDIRRVAGLEIYKLKLRLVQT